MKKTDQQITGLYIAGTIQERTRRMVPADHPTTEIVTYTVTDANDKRYYIDDYAPDSYHEVGDYTVLPIFIKPFRKKNGDPSYSLSVVISKYQNLGKVARKSGPKQREWAELDEKYLPRVKEIVDRIYSSEKPDRVSITRVERESRRPIQTVPEAAEVYEIRRGSH